MIDYMTWSSLGLYLYSTRYSIATLPGYPGTVRAAEVRGSLGDTRNRVSYQQKSRNISAAASLRSYPLHQSIGRIMWNTWSGW